MMESGNSKIMGYYSGLKAGDDSSILAQIDKLRVSIRPRSTSGGKTPSVPPRAGNFAFGGSSTITVQFLPVGDPSVVGYSIYRSLTNNPATGIRIGFVRQPPDSSLPVGMTDSPSMNGTYYYWASSINESGGESARVGLGQANAGASASAFQITYSSSITIDPSDGWIQELTLTANVSTVVISGSPNIGQPLILSYLQDSTGGWTCPWPSNTLGGLSYRVGLGENERTTAMLRYLWDGWRFENVF